MWTNEERWALLFIKFFVFLLNLKINLTLFHLVYLGNILQGNVVVYPSYYINQNFNSNNASQGCGLSPTLKISQSIIKILAENHTTFFSLSVLWSLAYMSLYNYSVIWGKLWIRYVGKIFDVLLEELDLNEISFFVSWARISNIRSIINCWHFQTNKDDDHHWGGQRMWIMSSMVDLWDYETCGI